MKVEGRKIKVAFLSRTGQLPPLREKTRGKKKSLNRGRTKMASIQMGTSTSSEDTLRGDDARPTVPDLFQFHPRIRDSLETESTGFQDEVVELCLPHLSGFNVDPSKLNAHSIPKLEREQHVRFLKTSIRNARFTFLDASRPWVVYWCLTGLSILGEDVEVYRERYSTIILSDTKR